MPLHTQFNSLRSTTTQSGQKVTYYSLPALEEAGVGPISKLPVSIRIVLEAVLRNFDGKRVSENDIRTLANWNAKAPVSDEIPFVVARIVLQDFTGVPLLVDLAAMRHAVENINRMVEAQNAENKATLQAINKSVDNTAGYLSRMETAMQAWLRKLGV